MKKAKVKDCNIKAGYTELLLIIEREKQPKKYNINVSKDDALLLQKRPNCEFEGNDKELTKLVINGKEIQLNKPGNQEPTNSQSSNYQKPEAKPNRQDTNRNKSRYSNGNSALMNNSAKAPYNFVPINKTVVTAPEIPDFDRYHEGLHTGYIDLSIEALTPLYIRDTYDEDDEKQAMEAKARNDKWENPEFFSPGGTPKIPGSSLRGMVRNLVEIVSYSKMELYENKGFYYRKVAVSGRYQKLMLAGSNNPNTGLYPATKAGWLKKENGKYYIFPLVKQKIYRINAKVNGSSWEVEMRDDDKVHTKELANFDFYQISFIPAEEQVRPHRNGKIKLRYALIENKNFKLGHKKAELDSNYEKGYLVLSGSMGTNKHMHPVIHFPKNEGSVEVSQDLIDSYAGDISREPKTDLLKMLEKYPDGVPCFYLEDNGGNIKSIGHTPLFRLAYDKKVKDHIPPENKNFKGIDFARAIFGNADQFAGRVFFEDAKMKKDEGHYDELSPRILSTPKPTTVQHYLEQVNGKDLADWNNETDIRGYKLYWHRITPQRDKAQSGDNGWEALTEEIKKTPKQFTTIKPMKAGCEFVGRIRFENLSDIELVALLFVLDLPDGYAHKIGMGKPLGLGSIRITPTLVISNRAEKNGDEAGRYGKLFNNKRWNLPVKKIDKDFKAEFSDYMITAIHGKEAGANSVENLWSIPRMKELLAMLRFDEQPMSQVEWLEKTRYMEIERKTLANRKEEKINEFKNRPVLSSPTETLKAAGINHEK